MRGARVGGAAERHPGARSSGRRATSFSQVSAWRHAKAIALLPGTVAVAVPAVILLTGEGPDIGAGLYRRVRNPMITAVLAVLLGEAALFGSPALLTWAALVLGINWMYFVLHEEPGLERRFGDEYRAYRRNVPRWIPRRTPWTPAG
jgi:hypothetical protein